MKYTVAESLTAPVEENTPVGSVDYLVNDTVYRREMIVAAEQIEAVEPKWCVQQILVRFLLL